ncbi:hypothetical protein F2Q69_00049789 [Brassica cretica]|uniref:Uncharacterized protein n=1 Tax=Brassica cretica TaxID=69181 RepID=A0A8S9PSW4_BRACR|nr:hypothetical protein F2Q69_00049789 [Brassica cretica]
MPFSGHSSSDPMTTPGSSASTKIVQKRYPDGLQNGDQPIGPLNKIYFHIDMGIPWICSWHFQLALHLQDMPYSLVREFRVKWWEKYNQDRCSYSNIQKYFDTIKQAKQVVQSVSKTVPLLLPSQIQQPSQKKSSPATSTTSSSS